MKTDKQIKAEIAKLKKMKPNVRRKTMFGDDNWEVIDAQISAMENGMDRDRAYDEFSSEDEMDENRELDGALEAVDWMNDEPDSEAPSAGWVSLVIK